MVFDNMQNCKRYFGLHKNFEKAFAFVEKAVSEKLECGRYEIEGEELFAVIQEYMTKDESAGKLEAHRKHIDIQYIMSGKEIMQTTLVSPKIAEKYDTERDVEFYESAKNTSYTLVRSGEYAIFFPSDIHNPGLKYEDASESVKKIVLKIKI